MCLRFAPKTPNRHAVYLAAGSSHLVPFPPTAGDANGSCGDRARGYCIPRKSPAFGTAERTLNKAELWGLDVTFRGPPPRQRELWGSSPPEQSRNRSLGELRKLNWGRPLRLPWCYPGQANGRRMVAQLGANRTMTGKLRGKPRSPVSSTVSAAA